MVQKAILFNGVEGMIQKFKLESRKYGTADIVVGYGARYAIYVHEDLFAHHPVGQAKFLEAAYRQFGDRAIRVATELVRAGWNLQRAAHAAGNYLLEQSRRLVPIDTGYLYRSGFVASGVSNVSK